MHDPCVAGVLQTIVERGDFVRTLPDDAPTAVPAGAGPAPIETDPVQDMVGFFAMFNRYTLASQMTKTSVRPGDYLALTNSAGVKKGHSGYFGRLPVDVDR